MKALVYEQPREFRKEVPVPLHLSFDEALFTESTAGAVHAMDAIDLTIGDNVLLFGAGPTGIIHPNSA